MGYRHERKKYIFGRKIKSTGYNYLPGSQYRESEGHLNLRSCLHDAVINSAPGIVKYMNKHGLFRQCPPKIMKDKNINEIENYLCVRNVMIVTPVLNIERETWGACVILRKVNDRL